MVAFLVPMGLQGLRAIAPYAMRYGAKPALKYGKKGLGAIRNYFRRDGGGYGKGFNKETAAKFPALASKVKRSQIYNIGSIDPRNIALQGAITGGGYMGYDYLTGEAEQSADQKPVPPFSPQDKNIQPAKPDEKPKDDAKMTSDQIKSGELDDFIKERIDLFEKYIGDDTRKRTKTAGYNAMVQFGLNLATKRGNLVEGIAESAKEPLKEFAKLGNDLMDRAASIKKAGIEAGVSAYEKSEDRKIDREALETELIKEKLKQDAKTLTRGEFITSAMQDITGNETLMNALSDPYYKDGKRIEGSPSDSELAEAYAARQYDIYRAVEIPPGAAGDELFESLPSGTRYYDAQTGGYGTKP